MLPLYGAATAWNHFAGRGSRMAPSSIIGGYQRPPSMRLMSSVAATARSNHAPRMQQEPQERQDNDNAAAESNQLQISPFWRQRLQQLTKPAAVALVPTLKTTNVLCWENQNKVKGSLAEFAVEEKEKHPDMVLLLRVGDFYEAYGLDALMLVEYAGLNPMGRRCRAGCPVSNVQATLDALTDAGLTVAVYEEVAPANTAEGKYHKLKQRALAQVVSPASPTYMYQACMSRHAIPYAEPPPYLGVAVGARGATAVVVHVDARSYRVHERLSYAALQSLLASRRFAPPLLVSGLVAGTEDFRVPNLPTTLSGPMAGLAGPIERSTLSSRSLAQFPDAVVAFAADQAQVHLDEFRKLPTAPAGLDAAPRPIYVSTATQIGLIPSAGIPDLPRALLPSHAPAACAALLRRWLLLPPRPTVADAMREACSVLGSLSAPVPACVPLPVGKLVGLLLARQANAPLFDEARRVLDALSSSLQSPPLARLNTALLDLVAEEAGIRLPEDKLAEEARAARSLIAATVAEQTAGAAAIDKPSGDPNEPIPPSFFSRNEGFRGLLADGVAADEIGAVELAAEALREAVRVALEETNATLLHDTVNNCIHFRPKPRPKSKSRAAVAHVDGETDGETGGEAGAEAGGETDGEAGADDAALEVEPARDRNRRLMPNRITTAQVREATGAYLAACEDATLAAQRALQQLCDDLNPLLPTLVTAAHWSLFSTTLSHHTSHAVASGWGLPGLRAAADGDRTLNLEGVWPYWLAKADAVPNTVDWEGIWLLTAPNMAGKSSLMRAVTVAALLSNAGLYAPAAGGQVPRFDGYFLRTASFDVPSEGKSAFATEMDDVKIMTAECGPRSLVMLDEIGRGTSSKEGSALGTALLEWLDAQGMAAVFATHLHEIEDHLARPNAPRVPSLSRWCLRVEEEEKRAEADCGQRAGDDAQTSEAGDTGGKPGPAGIRMTYELMEGVCNHSLALHVARRAGLPESILERANGLMALAAEIEAARDRADSSVTPEAPILTSGGPTSGPPTDGAAAPRGRRGRAGPRKGARADADDDADAADDDERQLRMASAVLAEVCGAADEMVHVGPDWQPPPRLAGRSCVYVLQLRRAAKMAKAATADAAAQAPARRPRSALYVGESDAIDRRLQQHRRKHGAGAVECVVCPVESKSVALELEAQAIRRLKELGLGRVVNVANAS